MMFALLLLLTRLCSCEAADSAPAAPRDVHVQSGLLSWAAAADSSVSFLVEYRQIGDESWSVLSSCSTTAPSCDVSAVLQEALHGCVRLRVSALRVSVEQVSAERVSVERDGLRSEAVEACSVRAERCTPQMRVSAQPSSLVVHLMRSHSLWEAFADHAQHHVCLHQDPQDCHTSTVTTSFNQLQPGSQYCASAQFVLFSRELVGLPLCPLCTRVLAPSGWSAWGVGLAVGLSLLGLGLTVGAAYGLLFQRERLKRLLRPAPRPQCFSLPQEGAVLLQEALVCTPKEEGCGVISAFIPQDQDQD
ncbi:unnamed protein product [Knipowitschia caucasica]